MPKSQAEKKRRAPAGGSRNAQPGGKKSWLERGQELLKDGDAKAAIACARSGLDELGDDYYVPGSEVEDDTGQKLFAAEDLIERGREEDGARLMLRMLESRLDMYARLHKKKVTN